MRIFILTAFACAASALHPVGFKFMQYLAKHGKNYGTIEEFNVRIEQFAKVDAFIEEWNANQEATSTVGHNFLSDWTDEEKKIFSGQSFTSETEETPFEQSDENQSVPLSVDWVAAGMVGPVQAQGSCIAAYAFAAVGAAASSQAIQTNSTPAVLSAQQIVSCSQKSGNYGCAGGEPIYAWDYMFGIASVAATTYPYISGNSSFSYSCNQSALTPGLINTGSPAYLTVGRSNSAIKQAIATKPTTVGLDTSEPVFQQYTGGIINTPLCNTTITGHALAVGYGNNTNGSYWIVQNSFGSSWGVQGYVYIAIDPAGYPGICGINKQVAFPYTKAAVNSSIIFEEDSVKPEIKQTIDQGAFSTPEHKVI